MALDESSKLGWVLRHGTGKGYGWFRKGAKTKLRDLYSFSLEVSEEDAAVLNDLKERVKETARVWRAIEESKGACWYSQPEISSLSDSSLVSSLSVATLANAMHLKKLIRKGIPPSFRPRVWMAVSGTVTQRSTVPDSYYSDLTEAVKDKVTAATRQIDHDLARTFPTHPWLNSPEGHRTLRQILVAYSFRDSRVGYCQGMNYVAALLLLVLKSEEDAFWMLAALLERVLYSDIYSENLYGCHIEQRVFKDLLMKKFPRLAAHLDLIQFDVSLITTEWFLCLFAKSLPTETTMRVWDVLFSEGVKVLFRVALAIFKMKEAELLSTKHVGEAISIVQDTTNRAYDPDILLKVAFEDLGAMTMYIISEHRKKQQPAVVAELEERLQRVNSPRSNRPTQVLL
ncbi:hypothetical protein O6H91_05G078600 [Diphasiastrum complanatum]|uniref:Uncharacterized protein n=2 Tax=Diphasiastrum complanatum TaxID=34168 RepID=A0ACC2DQ46_DIPCM|nr:hypothetical protein O6H91_05G078600 [Diphasiastrum complanatum]KAJ7556329.1 hypothetical protein O6H91_05G078600 [Diphasiastrum complanatum]